MSSLKKEHFRIFTGGALLGLAFFLLLYGFEPVIFTNDSFVIQNRPSGNYHFRTVIGYIAMIAGGNAKINRSGALEIMSYDFTALEDLAVRGGTFSPWTIGDTLSGGTLNPWTSKK